MSKKIEAATKRKRRRQSTLSFLPVQKEHKEKKRARSPNHDSKVIDPTLHKKRRLSSFKSSCNQQLENIENIKKSSDVSDPITLKPKRKVSICSALRSLDVTTPKKDSSKEQKPTDKKKPTGKANQQYTYSNPHKESILGVKNKQKLENKLDYMSVNHENYADPNGVKCHLCAQNGKLLATGKKNIYAIGVGAWSLSSSFSKCKKHGNSKYHKESKLAAETKSNKEDPQRMDAFKKKMAIVKVGNKAKRTKEYIKFCYIFRKSQKLT